MTTLAVPLFLFACTRFEVSSPSNGSTQTSPWIPVMVALPDRYAGASVRVELDGKVSTDPVGLIRRRGSWLGGGRDYIATLDLVDLEPGEHELEIRLQGPRGLARSRFEVDHPPCDVDVEVTDHSGERVTARVLLLDEKGPIDLAGPDAEVADLQLRDIELHSIVVEQGRGRVHLPHGQYRFLAVRGVRSGIGSVDVECSGSAASAAIELSPGIEMEHLSADLHVHTGLSSDSFLGHRVRARSLLAADIDVAVLTDHNRITDPAVLPGVASIPGVEARVGMLDPEDPKREVSVGHLNAFPTALGVELPETLTDHPRESIERYRQLHQADPYVGSDRIVLQLNHPRGIQFTPDEDPALVHALFSFMRFNPTHEVSAPPNAWIVDPSADGTTVLDFDAIELVNRFSWSLYLQVRADWFALINQGYRLTATGNSDSHAYEVEQAGFPVNFLACPRSAVLDIDCFVDAVTRGRVVVSNGPVPTLVVQTDRATGEPGDLVLSDDGRLHIQARIQAAEWVPVAEARLVVNGSVVARQAVAPVAGESVDTLVEWDWEIERDSWVLVEAGWPVDVQPPSNPLDSLGEYAWIAPGQVPLGFTNPVLITRSGVWTPPGLDP